MYPFPKKYREKVTKGITNKCASPILLVEYYAFPYSTALIVVRKEVQEGDITFPPPAVYAIDYWMCFGTESCSNANNQQLNNL